jgi:hypothetical protein
MKRMLLALLMLPSIAFAQLVPPCYPWLDADKAYPPRFPIVLYHAQGMALYWYCWTGSQWTGVFRSMPAAAIPALVEKSGQPTIDAAIGKAVSEIVSAADPRAKLNEITAFYAGAPSCADAIATGAVDKPLCEAIFAAVAANAPAARLVYVVAPATTADGLQPTYAPKSGALVYPPNGKVAPGAPCDCDRASVGKDPSRYCSVNGRADQLARCRVQ